MPLQLRSLVRANGEVLVSLVNVEVEAPGPDDVVIRVDAAPLNPSDIGPLFARLDLTTATKGETDGLPSVHGTISAGAVKAMKARIDKPIPMGNEGAGVVVAAGSSPAAQALLGKLVGFYGGGTYAEQRKVPAALCLVLPDGATAADGASNFVNPMTSLAMIETMRREQHTAIVHTAAASNLGQMLVKLCAKDGVPLVNIVRRDEQAKILAGLGAKYVCDSSRPTFEADLVEAIASTGATLAFDAIGGGALANQILSAMEVVASRDATHYSPYGSTIHKQLYIYGGLDRSPTTLDRSYGMSWGIGGWLVNNALKRSAPSVFPMLRQRVANELKTTFASQYTQTISLAEMLDLDIARRFSKMSTGDKYLVVPSRT